MPTWLVHGFRWPRMAIRIHIILQNLDDCAPGYIMAPATTAELLDSFHKQYPEQMKQLPNLRFIEQYDPTDETTKDQPYAYVCDQVHEVTLGVEVDEVRGAGVQNAQWSALVELRDKVAPGEKLGWFVVVNGDVERWVPPEDEAGDEYEGSEYQETISGMDSLTVSQANPASARSSLAKGQEDEPDGPKQTGFKKWLGKVRRTRSSKDLRNDPSLHKPAASPPLPALPPNLAGSKNAHGKAPIRT